jgi:manganese/iron transport system substrate-binding protein
MRLTFYQSLSVLLLSFATGGLTSCTASTPTTQASPTEVASPAVAPADAPKVVATTTILCDMVQRIAQDTVNLTCLLKPGVDGHVYQPVPADRKAIETAQLILYSGHDFEAGLIKLIQSTSNPAPKVAVAEKAVPKPLMGHDHDHGAEAKAKDHGHDHDHDHAEEEESADPHVWQSAANGAKMATVVTDALTRLAPDKRDRYTQNGQALTTELNQIHPWIQAQIATVPATNRKLVTTHDAMKYFSDAYNIPTNAALQGLSTKEKPTATRVKELVDAVRASGVPTIFAEVVVNPKLIEAVARDANVQVSDRELFTDSLGEPNSEADTYPKMLIANTRTIVEGLKGRYVAFTPR